MEDIVERGYVIIGSPDEVVEQLTEVATTLNVGHLMLLLQFGNMSKALTKYNTKLFAEKVMPRLHPLFAEWEDRWWPQPMDSAQRAEVPAFVPGLAAE
jgi:alkanesulfonate monooxygenase SsuD/methylene tetrahydromethanopterin reductase-like flavin-dependent oxidoreductase (luciferase family)